MVFAEHIGDDLSIFRGKRDVQVGCRFPVGNSPLDVRRVERLEVVRERLEVFAVEKDGKSIITEP